MKRLKYSLYATLGILVLALVLTVIGPKRVMAALGYTPVRDVDQPARKAVGERGEVNSFGGGVTTSPIYYVVPTGKRLVVESVSLFSTVPTGQQTSCFAFGHTNNQPVVLNFPGVDVGSSSIGTHDWVATQAVRLYVDGGTPLQIGVRRNSNSGDGDVSVSFTGYMVDMP